MIRYTIPSRRVYYYRFELHIRRAMWAEHHDLSISSVLQVCCGVDVSARKIGPNMHKHIASARKSPYIHYEFMNENCILCRERSARRMSANRVMITTIWQEAADAVKTTI